MKKVVAFAASLAACSMLAATPVQAQACWDANAINAAKVRHLDIMLMVTALRCRTGPDNFQADYARFSAAHNAEMNVAAGVLRAQFSGAGPRAAMRSLDTMSTVMANAYGSGHPELNCRQLKQVTSDLAASRVNGSLLAAADALVGAPRVPGSACAARVATVRR